MDLLGRENSRVGIYELGKSEKCDAFKLFRKMKSPNETVKVDQNL